MTGPKGAVTIKVRRWVEDPLGNEIGPADGKRGYYKEWDVIEKDKPNLFTNAGHDFISAQVYSTAPGTNGANWIALSNDAGAPAVGDTTVAGEITLNGLARAQGTYAHTNGTNTETLTKTWTATGAQSAQKAGALTASSGGTLVNENTFTAVTLATNDQLQLTWTFTT